MQVVKQAQAQGTGRHSKAEVEKIGCGHLQALSDYLRDKPFFFGNEATLLDGVVFAFLSLVLVVDPEDDLCYKKKIEEDMPNLKSFFDRMKEKYWPGKDKPTTSFAQ